MMLDNQEMKNENKKLKQENMHLKQKLERSEQHRVRKSHRDVISEAGTIIRPTIRDD